MRYTIRLLNFWLLFGFDIMVQRNKSNQWDFLKVAVTKVVQGERDDQHSMFKKKKKKSYKLHLTKILSFEKGERGGMEEN